MQVVVGRVGRAHGLRGELAVDVRTDSPGERLSAGVRLGTDPADRGPLTVEAVRAHSGRVLIRFEGVEGRDGAEALRGTLLLADTETFAPIADPDEFYDHELIGLAVTDAGGAALGEVTDVLHGAGSDLIVVRCHDGGRDALVPFVGAIVPSVDVRAGRVVIDPPPGLLDL